MTSDQDTPPCGLNVVPGVLMTDSYGYARTIVRIEDYFAEDGTVWRLAVFAGPNPADTRFSVLDPLPAWHRILRPEPWVRNVAPDWFLWCKAMATHALTDVAGTLFCEVCHRPETYHMVLLTSPCNFDGPLRCPSCAQEHLDACSSRSCAPFASLS